MKLVDLRWTSYRIPFRGNFATAHGALTSRVGALVSITTDEGYTGYGEIAPLPTQSGLDLHASRQALDSLLPTLRDKDLPTILSFLSAEETNRQMPSPVVYGLETALLDTLGKAQGLRVADMLWGDSSVEQRTTAEQPHTHVPVNAIIGGTSIDEAVASAQEALAQGFTCFKLKLTGASPQALERVAAVRAAIGPTTRLRLDANESWHEQQAHTFLARCADYAIEYIEQPLPAHDLAGMASLRRTTPIPLAADEAVSDLDSARRILRLRAADVLILKPQLAGGLSTCRKIIQEARACGVDCVITSTLEAGIGITAALHLAAASPEITRPCGLATLNLLSNDLLQNPLVLQGGMLTLPAGTGLGIQVNQAALSIFAHEDLG